MTAEIVGRVQSVPGTALVHASQPASVLVVLQNGAVKDVVAPGRRVGKFWQGRMPVGDFQVIEVFAGWFNVERTIINVASAPERDGFVFNAASVAVTMTAKINDSGKYADLRALIADAGLGLASSLVSALTTGIERTLRRTFAQRSQTEWHSASLTEAFGAQLEIGQSFGPPGYENLVVLKSLDDVRVEWNKHFLRKVEAETEAAIAEALKAAAAAAAEIENTKAITAAHGDTEVKIIAARSDAQIKRIEAQATADRYRELVPIEAQLGLEPGALADPETHRLSQIQRQEIALRLLEPGTQGLLHRNPQLLNFLTSHLPKSPQAPYVRDSVQVTRVEQIPRQVSPPRDADVKLEFSSKSRLKREWRSLRPDDDVLGISDDRRSDSGVVVCVLDGPAPTGSELADVELSFANSMGLERVTVLCVPMADSLTEFMSRLVRIAAPGRSDAVEVSAQVVGRAELVVTLTSSSSAAAEVRDQLLQPSPPVLGALGELLPFDEIRIEAAFR